MRNFVGPKVEGRADQKDFHAGGPHRGCHRRNDALRHRRKISWRQIGAHQEQNTLLYISFSAAGSADILRPYIILVAARNGRVVDNARSGYYADTAGIMIRRPRI